jgi:FLVCR family MFS transporter 7
MDIQVLPLCINNLCIFIDDDAGTFSAVLIVFGLVGAGITAPIVDKTHRYKEIFIIGYMLALVMFLFFTLSIRPNLSALIIVSCAALGGTAFSLIAVSFELAAELTYPVAEGTSAGFLWMSGQLWAIVMIFSASGFDDKGILRELEIKPVLVLEILPQLLYNSSRYIRCVLVLFLCSGAGILFRLFPAT